MLTASFRFIIAFTWSFITYLSWPCWINLGSVSYIWFSLHQLQGVSVWEYFRFQRLFMFSRNRKQTNKQRSSSQNEVLFLHHTWSLMNKLFQYSFLWGNLGQIWVWVWLSKSLDVWTDVLGWPVLDRSLLLKYWNMDYSLCFSSIYCVFLFFVLLLLFFRHDC